MFIIIWNFLIIEQVSLLPQVKRSVIISNKLIGIYELPFFKFTKLNNSAQKIKFPLRIVLVNVTKSAVSREFGNIYWRYP